MRVLIVKTSSMGDILHTLPALTDAMNQYPGIIFDWVAEEGFAQIPSWHPAVDRVLPVAIRRWRKNWFSPHIREERAHFYQALTEYHYDAVIDAQGLVKSAFLVTRKAHGITHGLDWRSAREGLAAVFYNKRHAVSWSLHAVERVRTLFAASLDYACPTTQGDYAIASHFPTFLSEQTQPYVVFLHATTRDDKHWPETHWRKLIDLLADTGLRIKLPWGAPHEYERAQRLAEGHDYVDVLPKMSLQEVAEILSGAKFVVSVDTGLSHLTAALSRPNVTLYGPTDPGLIGGYGKQQHAVISTDNQMQSISAEQIQGHLLKLNILK